MKIHRVLLAAAVTLAVMPSLATAADTAPPGNSAVDQYRESAAPSSSNSTKVPEATRKRLSKDGKDGEALANALDNAGGVASSATQSGAAAQSASADGEEADASSGAPRTSGSSGRSDASGVERDAASSSTAAKGHGSSPSITAGSGPKKADTSSTTAASATVGPFPVWTMVLAALVIIGVAAIARRASA